MVSAKALAATSVARPRRARRDVLLFFSAWGTGGSLHLLCAGTPVIRLGGTETDKRRVDRHLVSPGQSNVARGHRAGRGAALLLRVFKPGARPAETHGHLLTPAGDEPESRAAVDQFEEVFPLCRDKAERARFIDLLPTAREPGSRLRVCIAVRAGFYARCGEHAELANALSRAGLLVGQINADELREAVVRPAQAVGLLVEPSPTATVVEEAFNRPGVLPMLSHALVEPGRAPSTTGAPWPCVDAPKATELQDHRPLLFLGSLPAGVAGVSSW
ncbi:hypothetical protein [Streptomyces galilaeus]|uniref:nSTAND1 domain-containing NTPase n=1 Tax=Streptomyces galilaeus TaxID=33899 RepID=UPI003570D0C1